MTHFPIGPDRLSSLPLGPDASAVHADKTAAGSLGIRKVRELGYARFCLRNDFPGRMNYDWYALRFEQPSMTIKDMIACCFARLVPQELVLIRPFNIRRASGSKDMFRKPPTEVPLSSASQLSYPMSPKQSGRPENRPPQFATAADGESAAGLSG